MEDKRVIVTLARPRRVGRIATLAAVSLAIGCGMLASPGQAQSLGDRFKSLFGGGKDPGPPEGDPNAVLENVPVLTCPPVNIRAGASTYVVAAPGKQAVGNDVRFQATITKTARDCTRNGDQIMARIGIQGRVIAGPAGSPPSVEVPLRVAVVPGITGDSYIFYIGFDPQALTPEPKARAVKKK
jgi:hypothetical protein